MKLGKKLILKTNKELKVELNQALLHLQLVCFRFDASGFSDDIDRTLTEQNNTIPAMVMTLEGQFTGDVRITLPNNVN